MHINYAIRHMDAAYEYLTPDEQKKVDVYKGEMYFFRAYVMHRAALLFCEDYDPDKAADQLGLPYLKEWEPQANLARTASPPVHGGQPVCPVSLWNLSFGDNG